VQAFEAKQRINDNNAMVHSLSIIVSSTCFRARSMSGFHVLLLLVPRRP
jgi:hypothetical protein